VWIWAVQLKITKKRRLTSSSEQEEKELYYADKMQKTSGLLPKTYNSGLIKTLLDAKEFYKKRIDNKIKAEEFANKITEYIQGLNLDPIYNKTESKNLFNELKEKIKSKAFQYGYRESK